MERLIYNDLLKWKGGSERKPLILNGARQVGKTWIIREFGRREYANTAYINCESTLQIEEVFKDFDTRRMVTALSAVSGESITAGSTLIVLDEIQEYPRALTALKYFCEDAPEYHIIVAGSLLGISLHQGVSFPVGKVEMMNLYPMSFTEFVMAMGKEQAAEMLQNGDFSSTSALNGFFVELLRQYYYVGGMPAAVKSFAEKGNPHEVRKIQKQILADYRKDFSKHVSRSEAERIAMVWDAIPQQLAKENKKFKYSDVKPGSRSSDYLLAIQWLLDAGLVYKVTRVSTPKMPLRFYEEPSVFKLYMNDVGLLGAQMDAPAKDVLLGDNAFSEYKGAFSEQYVLSQMVPSVLPIHYYSTNDSQMEADFVVQTEQRILPIEVKAEANVHSKSLRTFIEKNPDLKGVRFSTLPYKDQDWMENVPLYNVEKLIKDNNK